MPGPDRKPADKRRRRNAYAGQRVLPASGYDGELPDLPDRPGRVIQTEDGEVTIERPFSQAVRDAWASAWRSPMAEVWAEEMATSVIALRRWAAYMQDLLDDKFTNATAYSKAATELRQLEDRFGMNPRARNNLGWVIVDDDQAGDDAAEPSRPTSSGTDQSRPAEIFDPRCDLRLVDEAG